MALHRVLSDELTEATKTISVVGDEGHHVVRVKRLNAGDRVEVLNCRGLRAIGVIASTFKTPRTGEWGAEIAISECRLEARVLPAVEVWSAAPKGSRLEEMIEGLSEAGAASWHPLHTERTVVEPREHKLQRLEKISIESAKQCGRAWGIEIGSGGGLEEALAFAGMIIVCDGSGGPFTDADRAGLKAVRLLVGPEGGWTSEELERMRAAGARLHRFGPHIMRIETAAVVAVGVVLAGTGNSSAAE